MSNGNSLCIPIGELDDCDGHESLDDCGDDRRCYDADIGLVCLPAFCGNGYTDPGEACDAGDNLTGDGCSADCTSTEVCGNGTIDTVRGERCDDGDLASSDGCSSTCNPEEPLWSDRISAQFRAHAQFGLAFDIRRGRLVLFGGLERGLGVGTPIVDTTFEWDGRAWKGVHPAISPAARVGAAMAYDSDRGEVIMFGGSDSADTWSWNGTRWTPIEAFGPGPRQSSAMAYDPERRTMVLFGGDGVNGPSAETWELAGTTWTQLQPPVEPPPATLVPAALAYDPLRGVMVLATEGEIWELAAGQWTKRASAPVPIAQLAYDSIGRRMIGLGFDAVSVGHTAFAFDGTSWSTLAVTAISNRLSAKLVSDPGHGKLLLYGGTTASVSRSELWEGDGATWTNITPPVPTVTHPGEDGYGIAGAAFAHDPLHRRSLLFGGRTMDAALTLYPAQTWAFDGNLWEVIATVGPAARFEAALAADTARDRMLLFGGVVVEAGVSKVSGETWLFDGAKWNQGPAGPPARRQMAMGYDARRDRVVLFGGSTSTSRDLATCACLGDTWEWDGTSWTQIMFPPAARPPALSGARMAYDAVHGHLVMFGGMDNSGSVARTWIYDGAWHEQSPYAAPPTRAYGAFAWDAARQRLVYQGGAEIDGAMTSVGDSWELDEDANLWRRVPVAVLFDIRTDHGGSPSPDGRGIVVTGGMFNNDQLGFSEPRALEWTAGDREETCSTRVDSDGDGLAACADPDCWTICTPRCPPGAISCGPATCGDGTCAPQLETRATCPADCGAPPVSCGDLVCDPGETCLADC